MRLRSCLALGWAVAIAAGAAAGLADEQNSNEPVAVEQISFTATNQFSVMINGVPHRSLWKRELMRQALLLAARSEFGLPTADNILSEGIRNTERCLELRCAAGTPNRIELLQGKIGQGQPVWTHEFEDKSPWPSHRAWVERMEELSWTKFVTALEQAKCERRELPRPKDYAALLDPQLTQSIDSDLTFWSQFLALRKLHEATAKDGETAARIAGLVRAYSHLGLLTEHQWHPMSYALKARALLYAQRWVVRQPWSKSARQHRAYAFALVGMHADALTDLEAAAKLRDDSLSKAEPPAWLALIEHYCKYDFEQLDRLRSDERLKPLASLLYFLVHEHEGSRNQTVKVGLALIEDMPGCYRMFDTLCEHTGPGAAQLTTQVGPMHLATTLLPELAKAEELPPHVKRTLEKAKAAGAMLREDSDDEDVAAELTYRATIIRALRGRPKTAPGATPPPPDLTEPSWTMLAQLIEETTFQQVFRRAFYFRQLGFPSDEYLDAHEAVIAAHRHRPFLDQFHSQADPRLLQAAIKSYGQSLNDFTQAPLWNYWNQDARQRAQQVAQAHLESLPNELGLAARSFDLGLHATILPLIDVSPHSPYAMAGAVGCAKPILPDWQQTAKRSPTLARALADFWTKVYNPSKAEGYMKLAAELDPSAENFKKLAQHYKTLGNNDRWLATLDEFLKTPSLGLEHARVRCDIAEYYANRREWDKALPYADEAAESWAQWAINWARVVNEINQNWDAAERWYVAAVERYGENPLLWYFFCQRSGQGNLALAREAAFPNGVEEFLATTDASSAYQALALILEGQPSKAMELWERDSVALPASWTALMAATIADEVGDNPKRDALLKRVVEQPTSEPSDKEPRPHREELVDLARALRADLASGAKCNFDFQALHASRDRAPVRARCGFNYLLGCYLDRHGQPERAIECWKECMATTELLLVTRTLAGYRLHKRGVQPSEWKASLFANPEAAQTPQKTAL